MVEFIRRIRERKIAQWAVVYLAGGWVFLEALGFVADTFAWPAYVVRSAILLLGVGFFAVLVLAWFHGEQGRQQVGRLEGLLLAVLLIAAGVLVATLGRGHEEAVDQRAVPLVPATSDRPAVAVLPFNVRGPDMEVWREGMVDLLSINLDGPTLRAIDSRTVLARWHERAAGGELDLAAALDVARATGARHAVVGTAVTTGMQLRLAANVLGLPGGDLLRQVQVDGAVDSMISVVDRLSIELLRYLLREGVSEPRTDLASVTTSSLEALKAYLGGEQLYRGGRYDEAGEAYARAIAADSGFALAYYRLGLTRGWTEAAGTELAGEPLARADSLANLPQRERGFVRAALAMVNGDESQIDGARDLAARYPDDPEAWYLLGELYYHVGAQRYVSWAETEEAFLRAEQLDPSWAPHYMHLVDLAFRYHGDSALAAERIARYRELAPESHWNRIYDLLFDLGFADSAAQASAAATLEIQDLWDLETISNRLTHPRFWPAQERLLNSIRPRRPPGGQDEAFSYLFYGNVVNRGWLSAALRYLDDPSAAGALGPCDLLILEITLRSMPAPLLESALSREEIESRISRATDPGDLVGFTACGALYARYRGRDQDHRELRDRLVEFGAQVAAEDSVGAERIDDVLRLIDGLGLWLTGDIESAYEDLIDFPNSPGVGVEELWYGQMLLELNRPAEAIPYFIAGRSDPVSHLYLARAYEAAGRYPEAREAYRYFLTWWSEADPALQPLVDEARQGLTRIAGRLN
ncbi:MAG: hypothetical protein JSU87_04900 [Gemmatimonadota bacterium]|nr:MAG: hypothetical protein JSU87_04900 [Gemmatimonadota bacterium]